MSLIEQRVTIVIPTYHRADIVTRAVESALVQKGDIEVIVVDDNGQGTIEQQHTHSALKPFIDRKKIIYYANEINQGGSYARNVGLKYASGAFITFLDDDDEIDDQKCVKQMKNLMQCGESYSCCYCGYRKIMPDGTVYYNDETVQGDCLRYALSKSIYVGSGSNLLVRTKVAREIGGYDVSFKRNQDLEFLVRMLTQGKLAFLNEPLFTIHYEVRENHYSYGQIKTINSYFVDTFRPLINDLPSKQSKHIYQIIGCEQLRMGLTRHRLFNALKDAFSTYHVTPWVLIRYFFYLLDRVVHKKSKGFKLD